jgi:hypothetical protein
MLCILIIPINFTYKINKNRRCQTKRAGFGEYLQLIKILTHLRYGEFSALKLPSALKS